LDNYVIRQILSFMETWQILSESEQRYEKYSVRDVQKIYNSPDRIITL